MKKLAFLVVGLLAVMNVSGRAQELVTHFSNNPGPAGISDQQIRLVNFGTNGTPLTSPQGDVCANIYVFDANQEMVACCSCRITPNGMRTISVANNLTNNPVTSVVPVNGDVEILTTVAGPPCDPVTLISIDTGGGQGIGFVDSVVGFTTHSQVSGGTASGIFITETNMTRIGDLTPSSPPVTFLKNTCQFARYLGSGKGVCTCGSGS